MARHDCYNEVRAHDSDAKVLSDPEKSSCMAIYLSYLCLLLEEYHRADYYFSIFLEGCRVSQLSGILKDLKQEGGYTRVLADEQAKRGRSWPSTILGLPRSALVYFVPYHIREWAKRQSSYWANTAARDLFDEGLKETFHSINYSLPEIHDSPLNVYIRAKDKEKAGIVLYRAILGVPVTSGKIKPYLDDPGMEQRLKSRGYLKKINLQQANFLYSYVTIGGEQLKYGSMPNTFPKLVLRAIQISNKGLKR